MKDMKNPMRNLVIFSAIILVIGQPTLTSLLEYHPTLCCSSNIGSMMELQESLGTVNITPENVKNSELRKEYFSVINFIKKNCSSESTKLFLQTCIQNRTIPKTFQDKRKPYGFNETESDIWKAKVEETDLLYVTLAYDKSIRNAAEVRNNLENAEECFLANLCNNEKEIFETHFLKYSSNLEKTKSRIRKQKIQNLMKNAQPSSIAPVGEYGNDTENVTIVNDDSDTPVDEDNDTHEDSDTSVENSNTSVDEDSENLVDTLDNENNVASVANSQAGKKKRNRKWISKSKYRRMKRRK